MHRKGIAPASLLLPISLVASSWAAPEAKADDRPNLAGKAAPAFALKDEAGKSHRLADLRGKIVVLEWTNPGCPFVKRHYAKGTMVETAKRWAPKGVVWLAVDSSFFNTPEASRAFRKSQALPYPVLQDPSGKIGSAYGARTTPHLFVIDQRGIVRYDGAIDDDPHDEKTKAQNYAAAAIAALVAGKAPQPAATQPYGCSVKYKK